MEGSRCLHALPTLMPPSSGPSARSLRSLGRDDRGCRGGPRRKAYDFQRDQARALLSIRPALKPQASSLKPKKGTGREPVPPRLSSRPRERARSPFCHPDRESEAVPHSVIPTEGARPFPILSSRPKARRAVVEGSRCLHALPTLMPPSSGPSARSLRSLGRDDRGCRGGPRRKAYDFQRDQARALLSIRPALKPQASSLKPNKKGAGREPVPPRLSSRPRERGRSPFCHPDRESEAVLPHVCHPDRGREAVPHSVIPTEGPEGRSGGISVPPRIANPDASIFRSLRSVASLSRSG